MSALTKEEASLGPGLEALKLQAALAALGHCASMVRVAALRGPSCGPAADLDGLAEAFCQTSLALGLLPDLPPARGKRPLEESRSHDLT